MDRKDGLVSPFLQRLKKFNMFVKKHVLSCFILIFMHFLYYFNGFLSFKEINLLIFATSAFHKQLLFKTNLFKLSVALLLGNLQEKIIAHLIQ